jgi:hypothetical protein
MVPMSIHEYCNCAENAHQKGEKENEYGRNSQIKGKATDLLNRIKKY